jgi:hypothetical protein
MSMALTRRNFLRTTAAAIVLPLAIPEAIRRTPTLRVVHAGPGVHYTSGSRPIHFSPADFQRAAKAWRDEVELLIEAQRQEGVSQ